MGEKRVWLGLAALALVSALLGTWFITASPLAHPPPHRELPELVVASPPADVITAYPFPLDCAQAAYCDLDHDSICTILYVAEREYTPYGDILDGVAGEAALGRLRREDFADCPPYLAYWDDALGVPAA